MFCKIVFTQSLIRNRTGILVGISQEKKRLIIHENDSLYILYITICNIYVDQMIVDKKRSDRSCKLNMYK